MKKSTVKRNVLLNPGPATTTDTVKYAQIVPDICPREAEFGDLMEKVSENLTSFVANKRDYTTVLYGGSGTATVESILSSVVSEGKVLIINNGAYGKRMVQIAETYDLDYVEFNSSSYLPIDLTELEKTIKNATDVTHLAVVHNETTTGLLNDIYAIGKMCAKFDLDFIVDVMSSYGAIPIDMEKMNIRFLAASSNKNLQGMAGLSFVVANKKALLALKDKKSKAFYLDLFSSYDYFNVHRQMRFTPPVQVIYALYQAILELKEEGISNRYDRYVKSWETLINGIESLGLTCLVPKEHQSKLITAIMEPKNENYDFNQMHDFLLKKGFTIYPGKLDSVNTFRIANIGAIDYVDIENFLGVLKEYLEDL